MADAAPAPVTAPQTADEPPKEPEPAPVSVPVSQSPKESEPTPDPVPPKEPVAPVGPPPEVEPATKTATEPEKEKDPAEKDSNAEKQKAEATAATPVAPVTPKPVTPPVLPVAEPDPAIKPVARKFTTPAGQELTVLVPNPAPPKKDNVKAAPTDTAPAKAANPPKASDSKAPESATPAAPVVKETKSVTTDPTKPGVTEEKKTVITAPPAPVPEPMPSTLTTMTTTTKTSDPATGATNTTIEKTTAPPTKAATIHEIPIRESTTDINHDDLRKSKSVNEQLGLPHAPTATPLEKPIGLWAELCAKSETTLIISEHIHSWSGDDYDISDVAGNKLFHIDGKFWSLSQRKHFKDMSGTILFEIRKRHLRWPRCWYIQKGDKRLAWVKGRVGIGHRHSRIHFTNTAGDGKDIELHLRGHYFAGRGAKLYLGPDASASLPVPSSGVAGPPSDSSPVSAFSGPPAAPDIMIAEIEPQDVMGPKARLTGKDTYKMTVAKNFDLALACIICVAVDERRTDNSQRSRNLNSVLHGHLPTG